MEKRAVLLHHADLAAQAVLGHMGDVLTIDQDAPCLGIIKTQQQLHQRRLTRTRAPDETDFFACLDGQVHPFKAANIAAIAVDQVFNFDFALGDLKGRSAFCIGEINRLGNGFHALGHNTKLAKKRSQRPHDPARHCIQP